MSRGASVRSAQTFEGGSVIDYCLRRAGLMVTTLLRSLPSTPVGADGTAASGPPASEPVPAP